jgi:hypothetical protein
MFSRVLFLVTGVVAHDNDMSMNMDQGTPVKCGQHDRVSPPQAWRQPLVLDWPPSSVRAMVGMCVAIVMRSMAEQ